MVTNKHMTHQGFVLLSLTLAAVFNTLEERWRWLRPVFFGPCTPHGTPGQVGRTWGTLPAIKASILAPAAVDRQKLENLSCIMATIVSDLVQSRVAQVERKHE